VILGHLTVTAAGHHLIRRHLQPRLVLPLGPLLVGAYLPDLLDKPLAMLTGLAGRGYGHSLVVEAAVFAVLWPALHKRAPRAVAALAVGTLLHLLEDWVRPVVLLAPLLGPIPFEEMEPLLQKLARFYTSGHPLMWLEVASVVYWLIVGVAAMTRPSADPVPSSGAR
jgi:membrane-bound metal-dependent hydrolase YbcI (DUF457 family)